eukprot:8840986-Alexandrium_andersonii.AAC.1
MEARAASHSRTEGRTLRLLSGVAPVLPEPRAHSRVTRGGKGTGSKLAALVKPLLALQVACGTAPVLVAHLLLL